jgi:phage terminase large subunit-like protein
MITPEIKDILAKCYGSTKFMAKILFPERFYLPFSGLHDQIFNVLDDTSKQKVVIMAPRGWGKTSIMNLAFPAKNILFKDKRFIVPISNTSTQAVMQGENLKNELMTNEYIGKLWGNLKTDQFSKEQWVTGTGTMVFPRGSGQQVRGILFGNQRPDLIICDDLEDTESVKSEDQRRKLKEWFFADVLNSVNRADNWRIIVIGTLLHEDSLLANLMEDDSWFKLRLELCDDEYRSNWPEQLSDKQVAELVDEYRQQGLLDVFYREYRNMAISTEDAPFVQSLFRDYEEGALNGKEVESVVIVDPAKTVKMHSDFSAVVGVGVDQMKHHIYFRDCVSHRMHPDELYDEAISMCQRLGCRVLAIEVTSLHDFITYPLKNEIIRRGLNLEVVELTATGKKEDRIKQLVPLYRKGLVFHNKGVSKILEEQLLSFPRSRRLDVMDAFAYVVKLLEEGDRYFFPQADKVLEEAFGDLGEEDYSSLYDESSIDEDRMIANGSWRLC